MPEYGTRMMRMATSYRVAGALAVTLVILASAGGVDAITSAGRPAAVRPPTETVLTVGVATAGPAIPAGFVGLSMEFRALEAYAGQDPRAINPVFEQLIRNLAPGQQPVLRIGGDSTDWTWWPVPRTVRPPGVKYVLTQRWLQVTRALSTALDAELILGVNLEANSRRVATAEAHALLDGIGASRCKRWRSGTNRSCMEASVGIATALGTSSRGGHTPMTRPISRKTSRR